jgi:hypothetical protein
MMSSDVDHYVDPRCPVTPHEAETFERRQLIVEAISAKFALDFEAGIEAVRAHEVCMLDPLTRDIYAFVWRRGRDEQDPQRRKRWVGILAGGASTQGDFVAGKALTFLSDFRRDDFDQEAWEILRELPFEAPNAARLIMLVGQLGMDERREELAKLADRFSAGSYGGGPWAALLALARMGDDEALRAVISTVRGEPEIVTRAASLFDDLAYTRREAAFDTLREYLHSDQRLPQLRQTLPGMPESLYAARQFALYVEGCPVVGQDVAPSDVERIRAWADAQTSWSMRP